MKKFKYITFLLISTIIFFIVYRNFDDETLKKFNGKRRRILLTFLFLWLSNVNLAQSAPLPGADGFLITYKCFKRETYSRQATNLSTRLSENLSDGNIPRNNKGQYDVFISELGCNIKDSQIQKKFKHAVEFGVAGNPNRENFELFKKNWWSI